MFAIFVEGAAYRGYKKIAYAGEEATFQLDYILVGTLPTEIVNVPANHYIVYDVGTGTFQHVAYPAPPEPELTPDQIRITQLEAQLAVTNATVDFLLGI